jgi:hypothetical protein
VFYNQGGLIFAFEKFSSKVLVIIVVLIAKIRKMTKKYFYSMIAALFVMTFLGHSLMKGIKRRRIYIDFKNIS